MDVLAARRFEVVDDSAVRAADVCVFQPSEAANGDWICRLQLRGFWDTDDQPHAYWGVDAWQALIHAMKIAPTVIAGTAEFTGGRLRFLGETLTPANLCDVMQIGYPSMETR
ncbi:MAG: hypothetical protein AAFX08_00915 [Pseudomonadota bacterium]